MKVWLGTEESRSSLMKTNNTLDKASKFTFLTLAVGSVPRAKSESYEVNCQGRGNAVTSVISQSLKAELCPCKRNGEDVRAACSLWSVLVSCFTQCWEEEIIKKDVCVVAETRVFTEECVAPGVF